MCQVCLFWGVIKLLSSCNIFIFYFSVGGWMRSTWHFWTLKTSSWKRLYCFFSIHQQHHSGGSHLWWWPASREGGCPEIAYLVFGKQHFAEQQQHWGDGGDGWLVEVSRCTRVWWPGTNLKTEVTLVQDSGEVSSEGKSGTDFLQFHGGECADILHHSALLAAQIKTGRPCRGS